MPSMSSILLYINDSKEINNYLSKVVPYEYISDMKNHIILIVSEMNADKLDIAYDNDTLKFLVFRLISKQMDPRCNNCFHKTNIVSASSMTPHKVYEYNNHIHTEDDVDTFKYEDIKMLDKIDDLLRSLKPWKVEVFNLYYKEGLNCRQISNRIGVKRRTINRWVIEIRDIIKNKIENGNNNNNI